MYTFKCSFLIAIKLLKDLVDIGNFVCVCILVHLSHKNPFESHYIGNLSNYFYDEVNNALIKRVNIEKQILNGSKNISSILFKKKLFLRKLVSKSFCSEIYDDFQKYNGTKLSNIFDLKYSKIHKLSIATLVLYCVDIFLSFASIFLLGCGIFDKMKCFANIYATILLALIVAKYILSVILFYYMEKGDIERYDDFLDCKNVKVKTFKKITDVNTLRNCFFAFVIMNIIILGIEKLENVLDFEEKLGGNEMNNESYSS